MPEDLQRINLPASVDPEQAWGAVSRIAESLGLPSEALEGASARDRLADFLSALTRHLTDLIDRDLARLPQLFYRLDIDERSVDAVFQRETFERVPAALAALVLERILKTLRDRERYQALYGLHPTSDDDP